MMAWRRLNRREIVLCVLAVVIATGIVTYRYLVPIGLPWADRNLNFGEKAFVVIKEVDAKDPSLVLLKGIVAIESGRSTAELPGAVIVVGVDERAKVGDRYFNPREIILLTSKREYILAPPGLELAVPGEVEVLGKKYMPGKLVVPADSKMPANDG